MKNSDSHGSRNGRILPFAPQSAAFKERAALTRRLEEERAYLLSRLPQEDHSRFEQFQSLIDSMYRMDKIDTFCKAYEFGAKLIRAVLKE